jgi:hypothetical protein
MIFLPALSDQFGSIVVLCVVVVVVVTGGGAGTVVVTVRLSCATPFGVR